MRKRYFVTVLVTVIAMSLVACGSKESAESISVDYTVNETEELAETAETIVTETPVEMTVELAVTENSTMEESGVTEIEETESPIPEAAPTATPTVTEMSEPDDEIAEPSATEPPTQEFNQWDMIYVDDDTNMADVYELYKIFYADEAISYDAEDKPVLDLEECRAMSIERFEEVYTKYANILDQYLMWKYYAEMPSDFGIAYAESIHGPLDEDNQYHYWESQKDYAKAYWEIMYTVVTEELQHIYAEKRGLTYWDREYFSGNDCGPTTEFIPIYDCALKNDWDYLLGLCNGNEDFASFLCAGAFCGFSTVEEYDCYLRRFVDSSNGAYEAVYMDLKASGILDWDRYVVH